MSNSQHTANAQSLCNGELFSLESTGSSGMHRVVFELKTVEQWYDILRDAMAEFGRKGFRSQGRVLRKLRMTSTQRLTHYMHTAIHHSNTRQMKHSWTGVPVWFEVPSLAWALKIVLKHGINHRVIAR